MAAAVSSKSSLACGKCSIPSHHDWGQSKTLVPNRKVQREIVLDVTRVHQYSQPHQRVANVDLLIQKGGKQFSLFRVSWGLENFRILSKFTKNRKSEINFLENFVLQNYKNINRIKHFLFFDAEYQ